MAGKLMIIAMKKNETEKIQIIGEGIKNFSGRDKGQPHWECVSLGLLDLANKNARQPLKF